MNKIICVLLTICSTLGFTASSYSANVDELMNPQYENKITLANMGQVQGIVFRGGQKDAGVTFTLPIDQFVTQAQLTLDITASDAIKDSEASLQVRVNGEIIGSIPLSLAQELKTSYTLDVPSVLIGSNNILSFGLRTEQDNLCLLDGNQAVQQVKILASSSLEMTAQQLDIAADLSFFPSPFWDVQNMLDNPIQLVFPKHVTQSQISAAGSLASWFGVQATYRGVSFVVSKDELPLNNAIVFGAPGDKVGELVLPKTDVPLLKVVVNPRNPLYKLLLIVAEDGAGMRSAVHRLSQLDFKNSRIQFLF